MTPSTTAGDLRAAKARIAAPEKWSNRGTWGSAGRMCMGDALWQQTIGLGVERFSRAVDYLREVCGMRVGRFNDTHSHAECIAAMERAARLADAEAAP